MRAGVGLVPASLVPHSLRVWLNTAVVAAWPHLRPTQEKKRAERP